MNLKEHIEKFDELHPEYSEDIDYTDKLFAGIDELESVIQDRDRIIENLKNESTELKNQILALQKEKSNILEELKKSGWLENKVTLSSKYKGNIKTILGEIKVVDTKIISMLKSVGRKKQANQKLTWKGWLTIPENRYLYEINESVAKDVYNATTEYIRRNFEDRKISRGGGAVTEKNYSLTFSGNAGGGSLNNHVTTNFNPDTYNLNLGFTVSYWVRPDEIGNTMFAFGRKHANNQRFTFGINRKRQSFFGIGSNTGVKSWVNMDTPVEESLLDESGDYWNLKTDGTWYHIVVTYDDRSDTSSSTARKVYVNGVLRQTDNFNWSNTGGSTDGMIFGGRRTSGNQYDNGWACGLQDVAIFNTAKDSDWVANVYRGKSETDLSGDSGIVGYWRFNEGSGTTAYDSSGNGNHGTLTAESGDTTDYPTWSTDKP